MENRQRRRVANPDDPPVEKPPMKDWGLVPGPYYLGLSGRLTIVQGQIFLVFLLVALQLFLVAQTLLEVLSGQPKHLIWLTVLSILCFAISLVVGIWPNRRITHT